MLISELTRELLTSDRKIRKVTALLRNRNYLDAAELLRYYADEAGRAQDFTHGIVARVESPDDPYQPGEWHDEILRLDPLTVVTTNFDNILERATASGFGVHLPDARKIDVEVRSGAPIIIKMHGSVAHREDMVLCRSDFARVRQSSSHMLAVMHALFLTRTCLFIGYSLDDPDMQLVLENVLGARAIKPAHFLLGPQNPSPNRKALFESAYGVTPIEYKADDHDEGLLTLRALADRVEERRVALVAR
ncbi:MAG TPA: SIR2 family protein [Solirubrobacteraceae bacterium]|jgi:hypothetical protein